MRSSSWVVAPDGIGRSSAIATGEPLENRVVLAGAANDHTVLILGSSVTGGASSQEANEAVAKGMTVEVVDDTGWLAKSQADFGTYRALILGDPTCGASASVYVGAAESNAAVWGPVITGNVIINGSDPVYHSSSQAGAVSLTNNSVDFAIDKVGKTGMYISLSCYYAGASPGTPVPLLNGAFGSGFTVRATNADNIHVTASHPVLAGLTDASLSNWGNSTHEAFDSFPLDFSPLAVAVGQGTYMSPDGTIGNPYIIARGVTVLSSLGLVGDIHDSHSLGQTHSFTATATTDTPSPGTPVVGTTVTFTVIAGPNTGLSSSAVTDSAGNATFAYSSSLSGTDYVRASFVDSSGKTQISGNVAVIWTSNQPPTANAGGIHTVPEGGSVTLMGTGSDPEGGPLTYDWDLDEDGIFETPGQNVVFSGVGLDGGLGVHAHVGLRVTDNAGQSTIAFTIVEISNVAPTVTDIAVTSPINENGVAHLTGTISDPGTPDNFTVVVNWGAGSPVTYSIPAGSTSFDVTHQYLDDGSSPGNGTSSDNYSVSVVSFTDDDGGAANTSAAGSGGNIYLTGHDIQLHGRQNGYDEVILDYLRGAGTPSEIVRTSYDIGYLTTVSYGYTPGNGLFGTVTTADPTSFGSAAAFATFLSIIDVLYIPWIFDVTDPGSATINSFAPQIEAFVNAGGDIAAESSFDRATFYNFLPPGVAATGPSISASSGFTATAAGLAIGIQSNMINGFPTHNRFDTFDSDFTVFEMLGSEVISIGISNAIISGGGLGSGGDLSVTVNNVAPVVNADPPPINENEFATLTGDFTDPGLLDTHTVTVAWGDTNSPANSTFALPGTTSLVALQTYASSTDGAVLTITAVNSMTGLVNFTVQHQYLDDGSSPGNSTASDSYTITVTVADDDGGSGSDTTSVTVNNVAPTVTDIAVTSPINENEFAHLTGTISDPGTLDTFTIVVNWGEGAPVTYTIPAGSTSFDVTYQYLDDGASPGNGTSSDNYSVSIVSFTDDDGGAANTSAAGTGGNIYLTGHDIQLHGRQNGYDEVILDYLRGAGTPGEIARASYDIGYLTTVNYGYTPGNGLFGTVTTADPTSFGSAAAFTTFLSGIDVLYIPWIFDVTDAGSAVINSFAPQIEAFVNAGGDIAAESSYDRATFYNFLPPGVAATGPSISSSSGFTATAAGLAIGIQSNMINGFPTHNRFDTFDSDFTVFEMLDAQVISIGISNAIISGGGLGSGGDLSVTVNNVAPVVNADPPSINENEFATLTGDFTDPGLLDTHTVTVAWGDTNSPANSTFALPGTTSLAALQTYASSTDSAVLTITAVNLATGFVEFSAQHQYLDDGSSPGNSTASDSYTITVTVADDDTGSGSGTTSVTVNNLAPMVTSLNLSNSVIYEGGSTTLSGAFADIGTLDDHTVTINWGDSLPDTTITLAAGVYSFSDVTHQYHEEDDFIITVTITDDDLGSVSSPIPVTVLEALLIVMSPGPDGFLVTSVEGADSGLQTVAQFRDSGGAEPNIYDDPGSTIHDHYTADINWGDGTPTEIDSGVITYDPITDIFTVQGNHTYAEESAAHHPGSNPYIITITIHHETAPDVVAISTATVSDPAVIGTAVDFNATRNLPFTNVVVATFTDPGGAEDTTDYGAMIDWGDGTTSLGTINGPDSQGTFTVTGDHTYLFEVTADCPPPQPNQTLPVIVTITHESAPETVVVSEVTIVDGQVSVTVSPATVFEDGQQPLTYTFHRDASITAMEVFFSVSGTANFMVDYTQENALSFNGSMGKFMFGSGQSDFVIELFPVADINVEVDETAILTVLPGFNYMPALINNTAIGTIVEDDFIPDITVSVAPGSVQEDGTTNLVYTFTRSAVQSKLQLCTEPMIVTFKVGGSAIFDSDYTESGARTFHGSMGTVSFGFGQLTASIVIDPTADRTVELTEDVVLTLVDGANYNLGVDNVATGLIVNDDFTPNVSVAVTPSSVLENGQQNLVYTFTRTQTASPLTVNFSVAGGATFGSDYTQSGAQTFNGSTGTISFGAGQATVIVTIDPNADSAIEGDETVVLTVTAGSGYASVGPAAIGTITNDDFLPIVTLTVSTASVLENGMPTLNYTLTRTGPTASSSLTVFFNVSGSATYLSDYTQTGAKTFNSSMGSVTLGSGQSTATIVVDPKSDSVVELDETVLLTLASNANYTVGTVAPVTGTITNDDAAVSVAVSPASVAEDGSSNLVYTFTRVGAMTNPLTVKFAVSGSAKFGNDYTQSGASTFSGSKGTVVIPALASFATVTIDPTADSTIEKDETVKLTVSTSTGNYVIVSPNVALGTITNDDFPIPPTVSIAVSPATIKESGTKSLTYTFMRSSTSVDPLTINFVVSGAATYIGDYTQTGATSFNGSSGTITFGFGQSTAKISIDPKHDSTPEPTEDIILKIIGGLGYNVGGSNTATGMILDI